MFNIPKYCAVAALLLSGGLAKADFMDRVLVIVNEDVITQSEFDHRMTTLVGEVTRSGGGELPPDINKQLLDGMVSDKLQLQEADRRGIAINDEELQRALVRFASQQNLTPQQLISSVEAQGQSFRLFSESVRESLTISRLTEYYAQARVVVPDYEIDGFIAQNDLDNASAEYQIAHILIKNPALNRALAQQVVNELRGGLSFQQAVLTYSEATDAQEGGLMGWRTADKLPEVFVDAIKTVPVGGVTDVLESANGLHILKLLDMKGDREEIVQSNVRHILIASTTQVAQAQAAKKLFNIRQRILEGEDFEALARIFSDDSVSAAKGGDLGWVSPGEMVPNFEKTYDQLPIGEISQPISTQYGMHILQVLDRREKNITDQMIRARADNILRRQRAEREFQQWVRELKEQAYIEYVSEPV
ncbi:MAG: peptidylprolyl isomerase [Pseudomonadota bacterium]